MKILLLILITTLFCISCSKEEIIVDPPVVIPEQYERFIGEYKVYDTIGNFKHLAEIKNEFPDHEYGAFRQEYTKKMNAPINIRYVKIEAENYGVCPDWHLGAGGKAWLFLDEIVIE